MAKAYARRTGVWRFVPLEDLTVAAYLGLWSAAERIEASDLSKFRMYAAVRIHGALIDEVRAWARFTRGVGRSRGEASKRPPVEIFSLMFVEDLRTLPQREEVESAPCALEETLAQFEARENLYRWIDAIGNARLRAIMRAIAGGKSLREMAKELEVSQPRISQLFAQGVRKLRAIATAQTLTEAPMLKEMDEVAGPGETAS